MIKEIATSFIAFAVDGSSVSHTGVVSTPCPPYSVVCTRRKTYQSFHLLHSSEYSETFRRGTARGVHAPTFPSRSHRCDMFAEGSDLMQMSHVPMEQRVQIIIESRSRRVLIFSPSSTVEPRFCPAAGPVSTGAEAAAFPAGAPVSTDAEATEFPADAIICIGAGAITFTAAGAVDRGAKVAAFPAAVAVCTGADATAFSAATPIGAGAGASEILAATTVCIGTEAAALPAAAAVCIGADDIKFPPAAPVDTGAEATAFTTASVGACTGAAGLPWAIDFRASFAVRRLGCCCSSASFMRTSASSASKQASLCLAVELS